MRSSSPARYPSDLTDEQWASIEPMVSVRPGGRPAIHSRRRIVDAILYVNRAGCSWRQLPHADGAAKQLDAEWSRVPVACP